jgi:hypothetical protein
MRSRKISRMRGMTIADSPCEKCGDVRRVKPGPLGTTCATCVLPELGEALPDFSRKFSPNPPGKPATKADALRLLAERRDEIQGFTPVPFDEQLARIKNAREHHRTLRTTHPQYVLIRAAQNRARKHDVPCTIGPEDLVVPSHCPILGIPLTFGRGKLCDGSPTVDRIIPKHGYVPGNVAVISWRANCVKSAGSADEHEKIAAWIRANEAGFLFD